MELDTTHPFRVFSIIGHGTTVREYECMWYIRVSVMDMDQCMEVPVINLIKYHRGQDMTFRSCALVLGTMVRECVSVMDAD